jgi:uncharacterized protein (DUF1919 family)
MSNHRLPFHTRAIRYGAFHTRKWRQNLIDRLLASRRRKKLLNTDFTVISDTCFAGMDIYAKFGLQYTSPTVGLYIPSRDYIYFLEHFTKIITQPLYFKKIAKDGQSKTYPIGILGDEVEIRFVHYKNEIEAAQKWKRRCARINFDNLFFILSDREGYDGKLLDRFAALPFRNKIYFSASDCGNKYPGLVVFVKEFSRYGCLDERIKVNRVYEKYFDLTAWLNGSRNYLIEK